MNSSGVTYDKGGRRKWDKTIYSTEYYNGEYTGADAIKEPKETITRDEMLKQIEVKSDVLTKKSHGLYCSVCNRSFTDSASFTTHLNSPEHNDKAGTNISSKSVSADDIKTRLLLLKEKKEEENMSPEEKLKRKEAWKQSRKARKAEWKKRQCVLKEEAEINHFRGFFSEDELIEIDKRKERERSNSRNRD
ncbi:hypothetical protein EIN_327760 [Entamoeba invadens IP1]|uniref:C2H2-type domain-containing protein n=1 Tax=Entamoeba invadens IP1 TaxID=370355 RepID=A0A0A1TXN2_ENTIV|nr:hypothetical protein EIN_327760 [Entamoeba invadens IP1]ELP86119.1 hypothetical protein EIN_327760 [Entamoeba invadens IP1]|eukprot:XP_004185465.1 hypothetical protein EIN_327760 [Entamoeba invadens IP1]